MSEFPHPTGTIAVDEPASQRWAVAFDELAMAI
jgi:hypothetical protein